MIDHDEASRLRTEEQAWIRAAQRGDRSAFAALVERYWDRLYRWLYHLTRDQHTAEDLAQESFMKAFAAIGRFRADSNFQAWLFRIGHNNYVNAQRLACRGRQPMPEGLADDADGPVERTLQRESEQLLAREVARLPNEFRAAFMLRIEAGMSFREMAKVLGTTEETARWRVFKARQKLLGALAPQLEREKP